MTLLDPGQGHPKSEGLVCFGRLLRAWAHLCLRKSRAGPRTVLSGCAVLLPTTLDCLGSGSLVSACLLPWTGQEGMFCSDYFRIMIVIEF